MGKAYDAYLEAEEVDAVPYSSLNRLQLGALLDIPVPDHRSRQATMLELDNADLVIDLCTPVGDALVPIDDVPTPVAPGSTIAARKSARRSGTRSCKRSRSCSYWATARPPSRPSPCARGFQGTGDL